MDPASRREYPSRDSTAIHRQRPITNRYNASTIATPIQPNSSLSTENAKSVVCSGMKFKCDCEPNPQPLPVSPPEPMAILDWMMFQPAPSASLSGSRNIMIRSFW
ncbi:hypothetical protein D3C81_1764480 [compost metagenome]